LPPVSSSSGVELRRLASLPRVPLPSIAPAHAQLNHNGASSSSAFSPPIRTRTRTSQIDAAAASSAAASSAAGAAASSHHAAASPSPCPSPSLSQSPPQPSQSPHNDLNHTVASPSAADTELEKGQGGGGHGNDNSDGDVDGVGASSADNNETNGIMSVASSPSPPLPPSDHVRIRMKAYAPNDSDEDGMKHMNGRQSPTPMMDEPDSDRSHHFHASDRHGIGHTGSQRHLGRRTLLRRGSSNLAAPGGSGGSSGGPVIASLGLNGDRDNGRSADDPPPGMISPNAPWLLYWSWIIVSAAVYNSVTVPYRMAFWQKPIELKADVIVMLCFDGISELCFFFEMWRMFRTGYIDDGRVVWNKQLIWQRYRQSWFLLDLVTCFPLDLVQIPLMTVEPAVRSLKMLRLFQVLHHYALVEEKSPVNLTFRLLKLFAYTFIIAHFIACIKIHVMLHEPEDQPYRESLIPRGEFSRYLQALYWSVGGVTCRDDSGGPESIGDAALSVMIMIIGAVWLAYFIACLEEFTRESDSGSAAFQQRETLLFQFMHQYNLPKDIQDQVKAYQSYLWSSPLRFDTREFMQHLPGSLTNDLYLALNPVVERASIFEGVQRGFLTSLVGHELKARVCVPGEVICEVGQNAEEMWFVADGELEVCVGKQNSTIATLRKGDYFGEYALFLSPHAPFLRTSTVRAVSYSTLLVLPAQPLFRALESFPLSETIVRAHVEEDRKKTLLQEATVLGLDDDGAGGGTGTSQKSKRKAKLQKLINMEANQQPIQQNTSNQAWTISPNSTLYQYWQIALVLVVLWNAIVLPIRFGFVPTLDFPLVLVVDYAGDLFLILDILLRFRLRFVHSGGEVLDTSVISRRYLRGFFVADALASLPLDFGMIALGMTPLVRLNRLIRLLHVHFLVVARMKESKHYEWLSLFYLLFWFLYMGHILASIYYSFTRFEGFTPDHVFNPNLPHSSINPGPNFLEWRPATAVRDGGLLFQYLHSMFFALGHLAGVGRHVFPPTDVDVILVIFIQLLGMFVLSYLIGKVGNLIMRLNASAQHVKVESAFIDQVLEYRKVDPELRERVTSYLKHRWSAQRGVDPNDVLSTLPKRLRTDIMMLICEDMIRAVPRFKDLEPTFVRQLVSELTFLELPAGEFVFRQGEVGDCMCFISKGLVEILFDAPTTQHHHEVSSRKKSRSTGPGSNGDGGINSNVMTAPSGSSSSTIRHVTHQVKVIGPGSFFGEGALFSGIRSASIRAATPVRLLALSSESFQKVMHVHPHFAEKILYLNQERQRKMEERRLKSHKQLQAVLDAKDAATTTATAAAVNMNGSKFQRSHTNASSRSKNMNGLMTTFSSEQRPRAQGGVSTALTVMGSPNVQVRGSRTSVAGVAIATGSSDNVNNNNNSNAPTSPRSPLSPNSRSQQQQQQAATTTMAPNHPFVVLDRVVARRSIMLGEHPLGSTDTGLTSKVQELIAQREAAKRRQQVGTSGTGETTTVQGQTQLVSVHGAGPASVSTGVDESITAAPVVPTATASAMALATDNTNEIRRQRTMNDRNVSPDPSPIPSATSTSTHATTDKPPAAAVAAVTPLKTRPTSPLITPPSGRGIGTSNGGSDGGGSVGVSAMHPSRHVRVPTASASSRMEPATSRRIASPSNEAQYERSLHAGIPPGFNDTEETDGPHNQ